MNAPDRALRFQKNVHSRYEQLRKDREQRQEALSERAPSQNDGPMVGTCEGMCPEFEMMERVVQKMFDRMETVRCGG